MFIETATFTVISYMALPSGSASNPTRDIYKLEQKEKVTELIKSTHSTQIKLPGGVAAPSLILGREFVLTAQPNPINLALAQASISLEEGNQALLIAKGVLAEMRFPIKRVLPQLINDPEGDCYYLNLKLYIDSTFEESLELDTLLTKQLSSRIETLPERLSFSVYNLG